MAQLHELVTALAAPWVALSPRSGQLTGTDAEGVYARDRRILSTLTVTIDGREPLPLHVDEVGAAVHRYVAMVEGPRDPNTRHDPSVMVYRTREVDSEGMTERITLVNRSRGAFEGQLDVALGTDLAGTAAVRSGAAGELPQLTPLADGPNRLHWQSGSTRVTVTAEPALSAKPRLEPGEEFTVTLRVTAEFPESTTGFTIEPPARRTPYTVEISCDDHRVARWVQRSLEDVQALQLARGDDRYLGAGPPWYLTLFGRDSLISAGMLIPVDPGLADGTLRSLAAWQGTKVDPNSAEQPGKIPHELRAEVADHGGGLVLPAAYYGTHDATQLWIITLHKAWRWGLPAEEFLPNLRRALTWIKEYADPDGDGFLEYIDESGHGLANQGWKDSPTSVQWPDGTIATAPIALCEVQGYAYSAAIKGAELLEAHGESGDEWRAWAAVLQERFRSAFWIDGYPAIALDGAKNPVAGRASNMGHLLGTGLLDADEEQTVADVLAGADLNSGFGLRTLSTAMTRFNPLGYHTGSVWPHDTAMTIQGLYASGHAAEASSYVDGLIRAAEAFDYRLPELYGGRGTDEERTPTPYPLSCRPQAWAAASAVAVIVAALGIEPDVPGESLVVSPSEAPWERLEVRGLRVGDEILSLRQSPDGLTVLDVPQRTVMRANADSAR